MPVEFEWNIFTGHTTLDLFHEIRRQMAQSGIKAEEIKDRVVFMSMYNDMGWSQGEENFEKCVPNSTAVQAYLHDVAQVLGACREHTPPRDEDFPLPVGSEGHTKIGPVREVRVTNHLEQDGIESQVKSFKNDGAVSWIAIFRETMM